MRNVSDIYFDVSEEYLNSIKHLMVLGRSNNLSVEQGALIRPTIKSVSKPISQCYKTARKYTAMHTKLIS